MESERNETNMTKQQPTQPQGKQYVREQKGHSILLHIALMFVGIGFFTVPYYTISKGHYWHL